MQMCMEYAHCTWCVVQGMYVQYLWCEGQHDISVDAVQLAGAYHSHRVWWSGREGGQEWEVKGERERKERGG